MQAWTNSQPSPWPRARRLLWPRLSKFRAPESPWWRPYYANPSYRAREQLWPFLETGQNPIDEHGRFLAWKLVRSDCQDIYTGHVSNHVGAVVEMDRTQVDDAPNRTCSAGLHICTWHYLPSFGSARNEDDRVMIVAVDPKDVVAVPTDYDHAKMRVCRYQIIGEVSKEDAAHAFENLSFVDSVEFTDGDDGEDDF